MFFHHPIAIDHPQLINLQPGPCGVFFHPCCPVNWYDYCAGPVRTTDTSWVVISVVSRKHSLKLGILFPHSYNHCVWLSALLNINFNNQMLSQFEQRYFM